MTPKQFDRGILQLFGPILEPLGFSNAGSRFCTYYRKSNSGDVYHIVLPDLGSRGAWYDIKVFAASPLIDPLFSERFPDEIGIPSDSFCHLSERGIGLVQAKFICKSEENFVARFEKTVKELLIQKGVPYLDQIDTIEDLITTIKHPLFLGIALHHVGRIHEATPLLMQQRDRLAAINSSDRAVTARLQRIEELLQ